MSSADSEAGSTSFGGLLVVTLAVSAAAGGQDEGEGSDAGNGQRATHGGSLGEHGSEVSAVV